MEGLTQIGEFETRLRRSISVAWSVFAQKVGQGLLPINKEASMQLHYAYVLQQMLPLITFRATEYAAVEMEAGVPLPQGTREIDILVKGESSEGNHAIAVEMKCYKTFASSGGKRGANDIFMKDVYVDLQLLEEYCRLGHANQGVCLVMTDYRSFVYPRKKDAKCWDYDISHGTRVHDIALNTPIGGKDISIHLAKRYEFSWEQVGEYWFTELEGEE